MIIFIRFDENNVFGTMHINIYKISEGLYVGLQPYIFCLLFIKIENVQEPWPILKSNSTSFWYKKFDIKNYIKIWYIKIFLGWIIIFFWKGGPKEPCSHFFKNWV